jgi:hypothetical protein
VRVVERKVRVKVREEGGRFLLEQANQRIRGGGRRDRVLARNVVLISARPTNSRVRATKVGPVASVTITTALGALAGCPFPAESGRLQMAAFDPKRT